MHPILVQAEAVPGGVGQARRLGPFEIGLVGRHQGRPLLLEEVRRQPQGVVAHGAGRLATTREAARTRPASCSKAGEVIGSGYKHQVVSMDDDLAAPAHPLLRA